VTELRRRRTQQERVNESTRRLAEAAVELIGERGYARTTAKDIGLRAGYSRAMVGERFGGKDGLLDALMSEYESRIAVSFGDDATGFDRTMGPVEAVSRFHTEDPKFLRAMYVISFEALHDDGVLRSRIQRWLIGLREGLRDAIEIGRADGSITPLADADALSRDILAEGFGHAYWWVLLSDQFDYASTVSQWRDRIAKSIAQRD
jgi:AcrR family transcriptional regulator